MISTIMINRGQRGIDWARSWSYPTGSRGMRILQENEATHYACERFAGKQLSSIDAIDVWKAAQVDGWKLVTVNQEIENGSI